MTRYAWTRMGAKIIRDYIDDILVRQACAARGIKLTTAELDGRIAELAVLAGGVPQLIAQRGVAGDTALRQQVAGEMLLAKLVDAVAKVTDADAQKYYDAHRAEFSTATRIHLHEIVTAKAETAYSARSRLASGESFAKVASEVSQGSSAAKGGDLGWVTLDDLPHDVLRPIVATLKPGEVSNPILIDGDYYIVMVSESQPGKTKPFSEVKEQIMSDLQTARGVTPDGVMNSLRRRAKITVLAPPFAYVGHQYAELGQISVSVNGKTVKVEPRPALLPTGALIVPAKAYFQALGCHVQWRGAAKTMVVLHGKQQVRCTVDSAAGLANSKPVQLRTKAQMRDGLMWVSPRSLSEGLGFTVKWDAADYELQVKTKPE